MYTSLFCWQEGEQINKSGYYSVQLENISVIKNKKNACLSLNDPLDLKGGTAKTMLPIIYNSQGNIGVDTFFEVKLIVLKLFMKSKFN